MEEKKRKDKGVKHDGIDGIDGIDDTTLNQH